MDKKIICKSAPLGSGSKFSVKLPETIQIPPNSEIALYGGKLTVNFTYDVNSTNDTFAVQHGSFDGEITGAQVPFSSLPPFLIKIAHGTYTTRAHSGQDDNDSGLLPTAFLNALNTQNPYKCIAYQGTYTANNRFGLFAELRDYDMVAPPSVKQYFNKNDMTFATVGTETRVSDTRGGFCFVGDNDMVVPAPNNIKQESIILHIDQTADVERLFFGYANVKQTNYRNKEEYNEKKDWVGFYTSSDDGPIAQPAPDEVGSTASLYQNRLPLSVEVVDDVLTIVVHENDDDGNIDLSSRVEITTGVDITAQDTTINCGFDFNDTGDQIVNWNVRCVNSGTGADLGTTTLLVPVDLFGETYKFACCFDSGQNDVIDINLLDTAALEPLGTEIGGDNTVNHIFGAAGNTGNLNTTFVFNKVPRNFNIYTGSPGYNIGTRLQEMSKKCNFDFFMGGQNYEVMAGDAETGDEHEFQFNDNNTSSHGIAHIQILNLPIENYLCSPISGQPINIIHSCEYKVANSLIFLEPYNLIYSKLKNKSDITINTLDFQIVNSDGAILDTIINTSELFVHLKQGSVPSNTMMRKATENNESLLNHFKLVLQKLS